MLIIIKTLFYWANAYKNGFLNVFSTGNLLNSLVMWPVQKSGNAQLKCQQRSFQHSSQQKTDFLHFSGVSCQKRIKMNIEWIRMAIPVLISKSLNRSFDNTVYQSRPLLKYDLKLLQNMNISLTISVKWSWMKLDLNLLCLKTWYFQNFSYHWAHDLL